MSNYSEADLIPFALEVISENPGGIDTAKLIENLRLKMQPSEHDLEILSNRNDDKFSQKVRNLKSHKTLENKNLAIFKDDKFFITEEGKKYLIKDDNLSEDINILENWELTTKTFNALRDQGIVYLSDLKEWPEKKLLTIPGFGKRGVEEIKNYLNKYNLEIINTDKLKSSNAPDIQKKEKKSDPKTIELLNTNILREWPLSVRTFNALKNEDIIFLGDLLALDTNYLLKLRNFGRKSLVEINHLLEKHKISKDDLSDSLLRDWFNQRSLAKYSETTKYSHLKNIKNISNVSKTILKDFRFYQASFLNNIKIKIENHFTLEKIENLITDDIEKILSLLKDKIVTIFKSRYGYKENYQTLEELGIKYSITRERVRQIEKTLNSSLTNLSSIENQSLVKYFKKYDYISFHKSFPNLNKKFLKTNRGSKDIKGNRLLSFLENYCGVNEGFFKTPEKELLKFNESKLMFIFKHIESGITKENFTEIIQDNYGYNDFVTKSAIEFMENNKLLLIKNNQIYPLKMTKNLEVVNILNSYPKGLHWKKIATIGNNSNTSNKWDLERIVADSSLSMEGNKEIYLCERGTYKLFRNCPQIKNKDKIIDFFIDFMNKNAHKQIAMENIYKEIIKKKEFLNLNFYDARAIIKKFGSERGVYHSGKSGTNTVSFEKDIKPISLKEKILDFININKDEIHYDRILEQLQKTDEDIPIEIHLNDLINENKIFRINPGIYLNYEDAINLCDKKEVEIFLNSLIEKFEFITSGFMREKINENFGYQLSNSYYSSLSKILAKENNWYYGYNYLSKKNTKTINTDQYIKETIDLNLSNNENFEIISKKIGISKQYFFNIIYSIKDNFNTDWVHQNE